MPHLQALQAIEPVHALHVDEPTLAPQDDMDAPVSIACSRLSDLTDALAQNGLVVAHRAVVTGAAAGRHRTAGSSDRDFDVRTKSIISRPRAAVKAFFMTSLSISLSGVRSATSLRSRAFACIPMLWTCIVRVWLGSTRDLTPTIWHKRGAGPQPSGVP